MLRITRPVLSSSLTVLLFGLLTLTSRGQALAPAVAPDAVDTKATAALCGKSVTPIAPAVLAGLMDVTKGGTTWKAAAAEATGKPASFHFRIALTAPAAIGAVWAGIQPGEGGTVVFRFLKATATYPGDPDRDADWEPVTGQRLGDQWSGVLPPGATTRAVLCTQTGSAQPPTLTRWALLKTRLLNVTPYAIAQAEMCPNGTDPMSVIKGGTWKNAGPDEEDKIARTPVNAAAPSWFNLVWDTTQRVAAIRFVANMDEFKLYAFVGSDKVNPALAAPTDWQRIAYTEAGKVAVNRTDVQRLLTFPPVNTRALSLRILEVQPRDNKIATLRAYAALADLKNGAVPPPPVSADVPPPFAIAYKLAQDGEAALAIDNAKGQRVRNLFAQVERKAGNNAEPWDLKDDNGIPVPVGTYTWKLISAPPLELHYEFTPYPNVADHSPDSTPWQRGPKDGWLSNHGNQCAVCVVGDKVFMGAGGTEGGYAFIETDFNGAKKWGTGEGVSSLFTDGKTLFLRQDHAISRFDTSTREKKRLFSTHPTLNRKGNVVGVAASQDKVYVAYYSPIPYLDNATDTSLVDINNCLPKLPASVKRTDNYGIPITPQRDFMSLFRLGGHINGDSGSSLCLESTKGRTRQQRILLSFQSPVPLGSLVFPRPQVPPDGKFLISVLKPDAPYPPNVKEESSWTAVETAALDAWNCVPLPPGTMTRALRLTFAKAGDDITDSLEDAPIESSNMDDMDLSLGDSKKETVTLGGAKEERSGRLEGMRLLRMRFRSLLSEANIRVNSGSFNKGTGEWDAQRKEVLSEAKPAIFAMEWDKARKVRGLAIKEIDAQRTEIDVYVGPATGPIDIEADVGWTHVTTYYQQRRNFYQPDAGNNADALYIDSTADFGKDWETRAVRLRMVQQWSEKGGYPEGVRRDRGGTTVDHKRCRVYGVAPLEYIGGEPPVERLVTQRLCVHDGKTGKLEKEIPSSIQGAIAFHPSGALYGIQDDAIVKIDPATGETKKYVADLKRPRLMTFDGKGRLYVYDHSPDRQVVRVYDETGKYLHDIGKPGPRKAGPYDPASLNEICAISTDTAGEHIWMVYPHEDPRRIMKFSTDGAFEQDYLGNTHYGGGGVLDPYDKSRIWYKDCLFNADWVKGTTSLKALVSLNYWEASPWGDCFRSDWVPIRYKDRTYLVTAPLVIGPGMPVGAVYVYDEKTYTVRMAAAVGAAAAFPPLKTPEALAALGGKPLGGFNFIWADRNGDGALQVPEVQFSPRARDEGALGPFDRDLGVMAGNKRYEIKEVLADATPVYEIKPMPFSALYRLDNGNFWRFGEGVNEVLLPSGERLWSYPAGLGMDGLKIYPWRPGYVDLQFGISGHATANTGDLGEFIVIHANNGQMNIWTADGMLAGHVTHHLGDPRARSWPAEHARGTRLDGLTLGQEHFHHYFCKTEQDGKFYFIGGGLEINIVEVKGIEKFKRASGEFTITPEIFQKTRQWESSRNQRAQFAKPFIVDCMPRVDGALADAVKVGDERFANFQMAYDGANLYVKYTLTPQAVAGDEFTNGGDDYHRYFKTGCAVDIQIGTDPSADPDRTEPVAGDIRVLMTSVAGKPVAVLYRPVAPRASKDEAWSTTTPAGGTTKFDQVAILKNASVSITSPQAAGAPTVVSASLPLSDLGLKIAQGGLYRMDWGVLSSRDGFITSARRYWANASATGVSDEPTEARLQPNQWGYARFTGIKDSFGAVEAGEKPEDTDVEDMMDSIMGK